MEGYWKTLVEKLEEALEDAKNHEGNGRVWIDAPQDHTKDYDAAIQLLEFSLDTEFELTNDQFNKYVLDEWSWQSDFLRTSSIYGSYTAANKG